MVRKDKRELNTIKEMCLMPLLTHFDVSIAISVRQESCHTLPYNYTTMCVEVN